MITISYTSPRTWVAGEVVTAALLNTHVRDNEIFLRNASTANIIVTGTGRAVLTGGTAIISTGTISGLAPEEHILIVYSITQVSGSDNFIISFGPTGSVATGTVAQIPSPQIGTNVSPEYAGVVRVISGGGTRTISLINEARGSGDNGGANSYFKSNPTMPTAWTGSFTIALMEFGAGGTGSGTFDWRWTVTRSIGT